MPTLGFSYLLKVLSLNPKPQRTEIRKRLVPSEGGYDFHASLRRLARQFLFGEASLEELLVAADGIKRVPERVSAKAGLIKLVEWRAANPAPLVEFEAATFPGPADWVEVRFQPDFGILLSEGVVAVHIWNTKMPKLSAQMAYAALSWLPKVYAAKARAPYDFAILSLQDGKLLRLSEKPDASILGEVVTESFGKVLGAVWKEVAVSPVPSANLAAE